MINMKITVFVNGTKYTDEISPDMLLLDYVRQKGCLSVKRGCETSNCGLCTVHLNGKPVLSCSVLATRADGCQVTTLEGLQEQAAVLGAYLADEGGEQCGFCSPGFIMNVLAMEKELSRPTEEKMKAYLAGNLCRCTGYQSQLRAIKKYLSREKEELPCSM
jgi:carbon-monoxide dehydrogenase small subunit